ncbi:ankyrin repeat protein [Seiridium cupressi]
MAIAVDKSAPATPTPPYTQTRAAMTRLRGKDQTDALSFAIEEVITASIPELVDQGLSSELLEDIPEKMETGKSRRELDAILRNRDIYTVYAELLAMRSNATNARKMLSILLVATRPLTVPGMSITLAVNINRSILDPMKRFNSDPMTFKDLEYDLVYPFETHLKSVCGNFVRIIRNRIYLIHKTARESLLRTETSKHGKHLTTSLPLSWDDHVSTSLDDDILMPTPRREATCDNDTGPQVMFHSPWQHSFSLLESNRMALHICITFIYMLGRKCGVAPLGKPRRATEDFLEYTAQSWARHFSVVREKIPPTDLKYYENLCHPAFPGFDTWTKAIFGIERWNIAIGGTPDQIQYYITGEELDANTNTIGHTDDPMHAFGIEALTRSSSNSATKTNSYLPLSVDDHGFVGLDFDSTTGSTASIKQGTSNYQFAKSTGFAWTMGPGEYEAWKRADEADRAARAALNAARKQ